VKVLALAQATDFKPGTVAVVNVHHKTHCALLAHLGPCDCQASVRLGNTN
jgi:hypothetical protein